jgi:diacylglycerol kinase
MSRANPSSSDTSRHAPLTPHRDARPWRAKFGNAFRGLKVGVRGHSSFFVHFFIAAMVIAAATVLGCSLLEWCILFLCIGLVLAAELFNSAIETLFRHLDEKTKSRAHACLDIAAGAVLVACIAAAIVGTMVFLPHIAALFGQ